jgi:outer membrane protein OmpU
LEINFMKKTLLATTALVGAALLATSANAGTVGSRDSHNVTLGGALWFSAYVKDEDVSANNGRGFGFTVSEAAFNINAAATADNGLNYGVRLNLNGGAADTMVADEAFAYISGAWGQIVLGDDDNAGNRMQRGAWNALKGASGPYGGLGGLNTLYGGNGTDGLQSRADWQVYTGADATKIVYLSPKFSGFDFGASFQPDSGSASGGGAVADTDNDGDFENTFDIHGRYSGTFDNVGINVAAGFEMGTDETAAGAEIHDLSIFGIGGDVSFSGFTIGAHYRDYGDTYLTAAQTAASADSGIQWSLGAGYQAGPWGISAWYLRGKKNNSTTASAAGADETEITRYGVGAGYRVAPGWDLRAEVSSNSVDNPTSAAGVGTTTDNDGKGFLLVNRFVF